MNEYFLLGIITGTAYSSLWWAAAKWRGFMWIPAGFITFFSTVLLVVMLAMKVSN